MTVKELAMKNYPRCWTDSMLQTLVRKSKLTIPEYEEITGNPYPESVEIPDNK